ncbi:cytochrome c oxidase subunit IV [Schizosaccharomyces japonicus yFS275]|uniref:Cytochrome c oxidase subunit IV n=1 Tax=Schizosaccharomyces japonicus (strain yFS275 / FY16936) TaxID=402676 RepID=B6JX49_SCHJY|nr:cytochrome c oxidase subunit IV [Schizosaccharomyces japonicus yFS275]EEB05950.2 cytochrome c oxidase subunit IV [Schizosaccharomyces japonicus yFS275]
MRRWVQVCTKNPVLRTKRVIGDTRRFVASTTVCRRNKKLKEIARKEVEKDSLQPEGAPEGTIPTDLEQSTGLERAEMIADILGEDLFDMAPLDSSRTGTVQDPIIVPSLDPYRYIGCTGSPADSHPIVWMTVKEGKLRRCPTCGSVYRLQRHTHSKDVEEAAKNVDNEDNGGQDDEGR